MNKMLASLCPHQVRICAEHTVLTSVRVGAVLGIPLSGIVGIEQVLSALPVLDVHLAQQAVQLLCGHVQFLGQLGSGEARDAVQHMVGIVGSRFQYGYLLVASLQGGLHDLERSCHDHLVALVGTNHHVSSVLADAWENFAGDPMFESLGTIELA